MTGKKGCFFIGLIVLIFFTLFIFKDSFFPNYLKEVFFKAGIEAPDVNSHHSLSSRFVWGTLTLKEKDLKKLISYLKMEKMEVNPEFFDKYVRMIRKKNYDLTPEEVRAFKDSVYENLYDHIDDLETVTHNKWSWQDLKGYSFYISEDTPPELRFEKGRNFEYLFLAIDPETEKAVYLACYSDG